VAWRWSHLPEFAGRKLLAQGQQEDVPRRGLLDPVATAREGRLSVVEDIKLEAPKTKLLAEKFKAMGLESVLVITDTVDENLYLASRNLPHVAIVEPRFADPLSLIYFKKILVTKAAVAQIEELLS
jgi:large subunit ribosomal protein L4